MQTNQIQVYLKQRRAWFRHWRKLAVLSGLFLVVWAAGAHSGSSGAASFNWAGTTPPTDQDRQILENLNGDREYLEAYAYSRPDSPWTPAIRNSLAGVYRHSGRHTLALQHWAEVWSKTKDSQVPAAHEEANRALAGQLELLSSLGQVEALGPLLASAEGRTIQDYNDRRRIEIAKESFVFMSSHPALYYRCGSLALANVARAQGRSSSVINTLIQEPSTEFGLSLKRLVELSRELGLGLVAVKWNGGHAPVPSVVHWSQNHYGALLEYREDLDSYRIADPTFGKEQWISRTDLESEASGFFLVEAQNKPAQWPEASDAECAQVFGRAYSYGIDDTKDKGCKIDPTNPHKKCIACSGMPVWWVSEPYISLWLSDEPVAYTTSRGESMPFRLTISQRGSLTNSDFYNTPGVMHNWYSKLYIKGGFTTNTTVTNAFSSWTGTLYLPSGGEVSYTSSSLSDAETETQLQLSYGVPQDGATFPVPGLPMGSLSNIKSNGIYYGPPPGYPPTTNWYDAVSGFRVYYADGSSDRYGLVYWRTNTALGIYDCEALLTHRTDPLGNVTTLTYTNTATNTSFGYLLKQVTDYDGNSMTFSYYTNNNLLQQVATPYGQTATFSYDSNGNLTNIVDAVSLTNSLAWDSQGRVTNLATPYGNNSFTYYDISVTNGGTIGGSNVVTRAVTVVDANGGTNLYALRFDCSAFMAAQIASTNIPAATPLGTLDVGTNAAGTNYTAVSFRNTFHWDPRQSAALSTLNVNSLTSSDYLIGHLKHWLGDANNGTIVESLSFEQEPSPDGTTPGQMTFYDYDGKTTTYLLGTGTQIAVTARVQPSGNTEYVWSRFNSSGYATNIISTYMLADGVARTRTNVYIYGTNTVYYDTRAGCGGCTVGVAFAGCPLAPVSLPSGETMEIAEVGPYDLPYTNSSKVSWVNVLLAVTNADGTSIHYGGYQPQTRVTDSSCGTAYHQYVTNIFTPSLPTVITNEAGYVTTLAYSADNRVTSIRYSSGLTTTNRYDTNGFLTNTVDIEIGRTNTFSYNNGLVLVHTDELGSSTTNSWDALQRLTSQSDANGTVSNVYYRLDLCATQDRLGNWSYFGYDPLRNLVAVTNANNEVRLAEYCQCGSLMWTRDALSNYTYYYYDLAGRPSSIGYPDGYTVSYTFNPIDQLVQTFDGVDTVTTTYNLQGLATTVSNTAGLLRSNSFNVMDRQIAVTDAMGVTGNLVYDALRRLVTNSVTGQFTNTFAYTTNGLVKATDTLGHAMLYTNDPAGRVVFQKNANLELVQFQYNAAGLLTNLTDGKGQHTSFLLDQFGRLTNKLDNTSASILKLGYDAEGRVLSRWTPANGTNTSIYDLVGRLRTNNYAVDPPHIFSYDANGRLTNLVTGQFTNNFGYDQGGQLTNDSGPWASDAVAVAYTNRLRTALALSQPGASAWSQSYMYDGAARLSGLTSPAGAFGYQYDPARSPLISKLTLPNAANITYQYDALARLTNTALANYWGHVLDGYGYGYNAVNWRTNVTRSLGLTTNSAAAGYDNVGQLTSWTASETGGTPRLQEQLGYGYDAAHNLAFRTNNVLVQTFATDGVNQLSNVSRTGTLTVSGAIPATATNVAINGIAAQLYGDLTFAKDGFMLVTNTNTFIITATNVYLVATTNVVNANLPLSVTLQYDANGNLTNDATRSFAYDAENQLTNVSVAGAWKSEFVYDGFGRRRIERDYMWAGSTWSRTNETRYIFDGLVPIQERDSNNAVLVTYTRGLDFSGGINDAGGIGGLLARTDGNGATYYHNDGSGNVTAVMDGVQNIVARYEYDPYGRQIGQWGKLAGANTMRFSSMPQIPNAGLVGYHARFYEPGFQRWLNRDPIGEAGGINAFAFVDNSPENIVDDLGFEMWYLSSGGGHASVIIPNTNSPTGYVETSFYPATGGWDNPIRTFYAEGIMSITPAKRPINDTNAVYVVSTREQELQALAYATNISLHGKSFSNRYHPSHNNCADQARKQLLFAVPRMRTRGDLFWWDDPDLLRRDLIRAKPKPSRVRIPGTFAWWDPN